MPIGKVKWFSNVKGYGFIVTDDIDEDLFAHFSAIEMEGYRSLRAGQEVEFEVSKADKGLHAVNIRPTEAGMVAAAARQPAGMFAQQVREPALQDMD